MPDLRTVPGAAAPRSGVGADGTAGLRPDFRAVPATGVGADGTAALMPDFRAVPAPGAGAGGTAALMPDLRAVPATGGGAGGLHLAQKVRSPVRVPRPSSRSLSLTRAPQVSQ